MDHRYSHAYTIGFEAISADPSGASREEILAGLAARLAELQGLPERHFDAIFTDRPFDTTELPPPPDAQG